MVHLACTAVWAEWIAIIAISKNENIRRKENWTEMAWKLQPLIHSEERWFCFLFFEASS